jgi:hypothetical protein
LLGQSVVKIQALRAHQVPNKPAPREFEFSVLSLALFGVLLAPFGGSFLPVQASWPNRRML